MPGNPGSNLWDESTKGSNHTAQPDDPPLIRGGPEGVIFGDVGTIVSDIAGGLWLKTTNRSLSTGWCAVTCNRPGTTGACCIDGVCSIKTRAECEAAGGTYQGDGTTCDQHPCGPPPTPTGACCLNGVCTIKTQAECEASFGTYQGDGTTCEQTVCPPPPEYHFTLGVVNLWDGAPTYDYASFWKSGAAASLQNSVTHFVLTPTAFFFGIVTFEITAGALPPGLVLSGQNPTGLELGFQVTTINITGTPTTPGDYAFTLTAKVFGTPVASFTGTISIRRPLAVAGLDEYMASLGFTSPDIFLPDRCSNNANAQASVAGDGAGIIAPPPSFMLRAYPEPGPVNQLQQWWVAHDAVNGDFITHGGIGDPVSSPDFYWIKGGSGWVGTYPPAAGASPGQPTLIITEI